MLTEEAKEDREVVDGRRPCQHANLDHKHLDVLKGKSKRMTILTAACARSGAITHFEVCTNETPASPFMTIFRYIDEPDGYRFYYDTW